MGYVKKDKIRMTDDGRPYTWIGEYRVVKESGYMTGIYDEFNQLITSKPKWSQAIKLAKLLNDAFRKGYQEGKDLYR